MLFVNMSVLEIVNSRSAEQQVNLWTNQQLHQQLHFRILGPSRQECGPPDDSVLLYLFSG